MTDNVPFTLRIMSGIYLTIGLIGIWLMKPPTPVPVNPLLEEEEKERVDSLLTDKRTPLSNDTTKNTQIALTQLSPFLMASTINSMKKRFICSR